MENFRISGLEVKNVGAFEDLKLDFPEKTNPDKAEIHIFTGENGTGKSTLLLLLSCHFTLDSEVYKNYILRRYRNKSKNSHSSILFDDNHTSQSINEDVQESTIIIASNNKNYSDITKEYREKIQFYDINEFRFVLFSYSGSRQIAEFKLNAIQEVQNSPFENILNFNFSINWHNIIQWIANIKTKEALELVNGNKEKAENYKNSIKRIENAISAIIEQAVEFILETAPLKVVIKVNRLVLDFDLLPDGLKSIISWISDLLMRMDRIKWVNDIDVLDRNFILFLDEIEVHLHPAWQRKILPVIQKLFKNAQIFISTHSPFVVGSVDDAWIYRFKLDEQGNSHLDGNPIQSEDAKSYPHILQEIFGIKARFGVEIEKKLEEFYKLRDELFKGKEENQSEIKKIIEELSGQSIELDGILGFELRQIEKIIKQPVLDK